MKDTWIHFYAINDYSTCEYMHFKCFTFPFKKNSTFNTYNKIFIYIKKRKMFVYVSIFLLTMASEANHMMGLACMDMDRQTHIRKHIKLTFCLIFWYLHNNLTKNFYWKLMKEVRLLSVRRGREYFYACPRETLSFTQTEKEII